MTEKKPPDLARAMRIITALFVVFIFTMGGLVWAVYSDATSRSDQLQSAIDEMNAVRATARVSTCEGLATFQLAHNDLVRRNQDLLRTVAAQSTRPETQAFVDEQVALYEANIVPVRDCSPEGIEAFSNGTGGYLPTPP